MSIIIGIDHGYYAIKTAHCSFPAGITRYGEHEPYTRQGLLEVGGCFFACGTGRQPIQRDKTVNDNYYLLTLAAIAKEIKQRGLPPSAPVTAGGSRFGTHQRGAIMSKKATEFQREAMSPDGCSLGGACLTRLLALGKILVEPLNARLDKDSRSNWLKYRICSIALLLYTF